MLLQSSGSVFVRWLTGHEDSSRGLEAEGVDGEAISRLVGVLGDVMRVAREEVAFCVR